ncbi:MAG: GDP-mannose 4,6-dehydratase [Gemmatimonadaceae bacterium]
MRALLTGGAGFVGQWLARALLQRGGDVDLAGLGDAFAGPNVLSLDERRATRWIAADVRDADQVEQAIERSRPDAVVHLAGVSFPPDAEQAPASSFDVNALGAVRLLSAIRRRTETGVLDPVVLIVGTGTQYGTHDASAMPLDERAERRPLTTYAASKAAQEVAALQVCRASAMRVICTRSFNHSGIGHGAQYLLPSLVARTRRIARGADRTLTLGNDVVRDYLHVDDVVSAYLHLLERGRAGEVYNVASGRGLSVTQLAADVLLRAGVRADISTAPALVRSSDTPILVGSPAKLTRDTGWIPLKTHADIIDDLLNAATD